MNTHQATLLLVDDDEMNRDALSRRLVRNGYNVLTAASGPDALAMVRAHRIDAVLLDVMMPGMSGIETLQRLRRSRSAADLPVIMVTANDASRDVVEALDLGANDYVTKPVDFAVALARIRTQVTARRADPLTGLANRALFMDRLSALIGRESAGGFAVFFLDVDRFKIINDSLGHLAGDELLIEIARRLERSLRSSDTVSRFSGEHTLARLGGDEFTVLVEGSMRAEDARAIANRLLTAVMQPFVLQGREVVTSISLGIVMSDARYRHAEEMVRDADTAMYRAKALGRARCAVFDSSMLAEMERRLQLESDLRHAVERQQLVVHYQPIVELANGSVTGFEALLRWQHPDHGLVPPYEFIPMAEETGLIVPIGDWVLQEACRQIRLWDERFPERARLTINVNLSARQCTEPGLVESVARTLAEIGLEPGRLKLEITEGVLLEASDDVEKRLTDLHRLGVRLGLDDFGMGYSALSYLQRYPFQTIKIDRAFVQNIHESGNAEIVRAIVAMAAGLSMDVTAEGVETDEQLARLKSLSCEFAQGFYFHKPLAPPEVENLLAADRTEPASENPDVVSRQTADAGAGSRVGRRTA
jgi:diguanylate cyclase (GGDEF)-like protein